MGCGMAIQQTNFLMISLLLWWSCATPVCGSTSRRRKTWVKRYSSVCIQSWKFWGMSLQAWFTFTVCRLCMATSQLLTFSSASKELKWLPCVSGYVVGRGGAPFFYCSWRWALAIPLPLIFNLDSCFQATCTPHTITCVLDKHYILYLCTHSIYLSIYLSNTQLTTKSFHQHSIWFLSSCKFSPQYTSTTKQWPQSTHVATCAFVRVLARASCSSCVVIHGNCCNGLLLYMYSTFHAVTSMLLD